MTYEEKIIISFLFKRSGKEKLTFSELYLALSIDLKWFTPKKAKDFLNSALEKNFLVKKNDLISPNFNYNKILIPIGFRPSNEFFIEYKNDFKENENILNRIVNRIAEKSESSKKDIFEKINYIEKNRNLFLEVAALLVGKENNVNLEDFFKIIEDEIFRIPRIK
jgi:hypothetical protein